MNTILKTNGSQKKSSETATQDESSGGSSAHCLPGEESPMMRPTDRHIVRSSSNLTDRYHGPCTLFALCNELCDTLLSVQVAQTPTSVDDGLPQSKRHNRPAINDAAKDLLGRMCLEAGIEESSDFQADFTPVRLPPKQFLLMAQTQFFQQVDYATDLFVQSRFWSNVERVYSRRLTPADEAWAICYNAIILLVLGPASLEQNCDSHIVSQFVGPFLVNIRSALCNPQVLMVAKIVNVQALALLVSTPYISSLLLRLILL